MRLTCDLQEALPVCAPEKDSCLPPVDLFPIFYHFLTHLKYQKHQTDKYEILEEATHGHTLKKKTTTTKKTAEIWKFLYLPCGVGRKKTLVPSTAPRAPSQRWISRFSLQFDFIAAPPFSALHLWVSYIPPECAWMRCRFSGLSKIHRAAICVWHSPRRTYLCFTLSPSNTFISSLSSILFCAVVFWYPPCQLDPLSPVSVFLIAYNAARLYLFLLFPPARLRSLLLCAVRGQRHQSPLLFEQSTQTEGPASRWVSRQPPPSPHFCFQFMLYGSDGYLHSYTD